MAGLPRVTAEELCGEALSGRSRLLSRRRDGQPPLSVTSPPLLAKRLADVVEGDIIPRLVLAHARPQPHIESVAGDWPFWMADETVEDFVLLALSGDHDALMAVVGAMVERGVTMEAVYLDLLAPVARRLGERWLDDTISFVDVTIALGKLQLVVHALSLHGPVGADEPSGGRSAYFTNAPGEQHTFGVSIVAEFFRRAGWMAAVSCDSDPAVVLEAVRRRHFDVVGITIACVEHLAQLKPFVMSIRRVSINPDTVVLVGGRLLSERPGLAKEVGADCSAGDAREAFLTAEGAVRLLARR